MKIVWLVLLFAMQLQAQTWITSIKSDPAAKTAKIKWSTAVPANSKVKWGKNTNYGSNTGTDFLMVTQHGMTLTGLTPLMTYHFRVMSADSSGILVTSLDGMFSTSRHAVIFTWNASTTAGAKYTISRSSTQAGPYTDLASQIDDLSYTDRMVVGGQSYWYKVRATAPGLADSTPVQSAKMTIPTT